ncbi:MAG TPA: peptidylprolyl isomerase [Candidatus Limnocylindrales bacterium]|nr:peptidylprolyl isomerase [Candidatus Limnocylindrales bacterium]
MSTDQNRPRPRSSKKRRAVQAGAARRAPAAGRVRGGGATPSSGGIPGLWLAIGAVGVFIAGVLLASGTIGGAKPSSSADAYSTGAAGSAGPSSEVRGSVSVVPPSAADSSAPGGSVTGGIPSGCPKAQPPAAAAGSTKTVTIETPSGKMVLTLQADLSPIAVGNFVALASCGYYDGVVFHRVVPNFVIQGGDGQYARTGTYDPSRAGTGGPGYEIQDEPVTTQYSRGTVAMARTSAPNSVGSQFFIVLSDDARTALQSANTYQILGTVTSGMDVADAIAAAADAENPTNPIPMTKVTVAP